MKNKLAIHGGTKVRTEPFPANEVIGTEEKEAVEKVLDRGILSQFLGSDHELFYGGEQVQLLEKEWADYFGVKHAIAVNSCTSGLYCAVGATGVEPGEEIIVSPYTMCASATAPIIFNAVPIFADIEDDFYCLSAERIREKITPQTRAIIIVDLFGQPYDAEKVNAVARQHELVVIEDCAQAPGGALNGKPTGSLGDIGVFSLNYHKHIHSGEGGVVTTNNDLYADRIRKIRNHAEAVASADSPAGLVNMIGFNFRMTEIEAAIARCQLKKLDNLLNQRIKHCRLLQKRLTEIPAITAGPSRPGAKHVYYVLPMQFDEAAAGISRDVFIDAVKAELPCTHLREKEGVKIGSGYVKPLYLLDMFQNQTAYGSKGCPFQCSRYNKKLVYTKGLCPVTERKHEKELFIIDLIHPAMKESDLRDVIEAFQKVWDRRDQLK